MGLIDGLHNVPERFKSCCSSLAPLPTNNNNNNYKGLSLDESHPSVVLTLIISQLLSTAPLKFFLFYLFTALFFSKQN